MAPWWKNPAVEAQLNVLYVNMIFVLLGVYGWEYLHSFGIEYAVIRRRLPLRWAFVPYLLGRLSLLTVLLLLAVGMSASNLACQPGILWVAISGAFSIGCSSTNLMIRTWVIWKHSRLVHTLVLVAALGHWAILMLDVVNIRAFGSDGTCVVYLTSPSVSAGVFIYTVCYDFLVLVFSFVGLSQQPSQSPLTERLRTQGVLYFLVVAIAYIPPTVFSLLGITPMVGIAGSTAMTASMIGSCKVVRSLLVLGTQDTSALLEGAQERDVVLTTQCVDRDSVVSMGIF